METTQLKTTAEKENLVIYINEALESKNLFGDHAGNDFENMMKISVDLLDGLKYRIEDFEGNDNLKDDTLQKIYQLETMVKMMWDKMNYQTIYDAGTAFEYMEKYKNTLGDNAKLKTEIYIKNMMHSFIDEKGLSDEYYKEFRYKYANENLKEFSETTMFPSFMESLAEAGNIIEIERIKSELKIM